MPRSPRTALLAVLALLGALVLSGCGSDEPTAAVAIAKSGMLGPIGEQLKREDDDTEAAELRETQPESREEREEAHELAEEAEQQGGETSATPSQLLEGEGEEGEARES
jgi:hypothetical protein